MAINSAPRRDISTSSTPADCEASSTNGTSASLHSRAMSYTGRTKPKTFETCVHTTAFAPGMRRRKASSVAAVSKSGARATSISAPSI